MDLHLPQIPTHPGTILPRVNPFKSLAITRGHAQTSGTPEDTLVNQPPNQEKSLRLLLVVHVGLCFHGGLNVHLA